MEKHWRLIIERKNARHTQKFVAKKLGLSTYRYGQKELNKNNFTLPEAQQLSEMYGVSVDELFNKQKTPTVCRQ